MNEQPTKTTNTNGQTAVIYYSRKNGNVKLFTDKELARKYAFDLAVEMNKHFQKPEETYYPDPIEQINGEFDFHNQYIGENGEFEISILPVVA